MVVLTEVGAGAKNPSLIGRAVVFEIIGIGSNPMGCVSAFLKKVSQKFIKRMS
jgi:hypothetical protein